MSDFNGIFGRPFAHQVAAFRLRLGNLVPTSSWDDLTRAAHDRAFMVAGATKADLLADLAAALDQSIAGGKGYQAFKADFKAAVARNDWHGWTGEGSKAGEAWRMRTIFRTNMATSYQAGRYAQLIEGNFNYWIYRHGGSLHPREHHLAWDGLILPPDHPFWTFAYPPNDWGCSCYVVGARSLKMAERLGGKPGLKLPENWQDLDPRTGAPAGIGKNWDYAPGRSVQNDIEVMATKFVNWPSEIMRAFLLDLPRDKADDISAAYRRLQSTRSALRRFARSEQASEEFFSAGLARQSVARQVADLTGRDVSGHDFAFSLGSLRHVFRKHGDESGGAFNQVSVTEDHLSWLLDTIDLPDAIEIEEQRGDTPVIAVSRQFPGGRLRALFEVGGRRRPRLKLKSFWIAR